MPLHLIKLVVGLNSLKDFATWQQQEVMPYSGQKANIVRTRFKPKRAVEILESCGSIYRVIGGQIICRQRILGFETVENTARGTHCLILTHTDIIKTRPTPRRAFQGWRYLQDNDAPRDVGPYRHGENEPLHDMDIELMELGLL